MKFPDSWILASGSPRRRELLARINPDFRIEVPDVEEWLPEEADPVEQVEENSLRKGNIVASQHPSSLVIASDTTVALGRRVLGKPGSEKEAIAMLLALSGKTHRVVTGVYLGWKGERRIFHDSSEVTFHEIDEQRIRLYMERVHVMDKAGAYGIQEHGDLIIQGYTGSFENIMGLPIQRLWQELVQLGWAGSLRPEL